MDSAAEAHNLALLLRAGALIAPISIVEERTIGPSMGLAKHRYAYSGAYLGYGSGNAIVTLLYYRGFGLIANIALMANLVLIIGVMSMIPGATMTLPGIAGIVLTVGMAVDANVLIFERVRNRFGDGAQSAKCVKRFTKVTRTRSVPLPMRTSTTLITAIILFAVGTGAARFRGNTIHRYLDFNVHRYHYWHTLYREPTVWWQTRWIKLSI
ncbi:hypothetical protein P4S64_23970 [Vibrio sp. M60_M31a]